MSTSSGDEPSPDLSDAELEAFLKNAAEGFSGGAPPPKEPSARARMVARRLREADEAAARRGKKGRPADPPGWRTGPAWQETNGRRARRRRGLAVAGVVVAVAVAVVAVRPSLLLDRFGGAGGAGGGGSAASEPGDPGLPTRAEPFRGSPALSWADGADGIELPRAEAVGDMSQADVADALRLTKELLVAANLDPQVLGGGRPEQAIGLLDPESPGLTSRLERSLSDPDREDDPLTLFTRFDPDEARVIGDDAVKVRGEMTYEAGDPGSVEVHADYTFVYAVERVGGGDDAVDRTIVRRDWTVMLADPERWEATEGRLLPKSYYANFGNTACEVYDGYLHPTFAGVSTTGSPATGPEVDPYDRSEPLTGELDSTCGRVART